MARGPADPAAGGVTKRPLRLPVMAATAAAVVLVLIGGGLWLFRGGGDEPPLSTADRVVAKLPPAPRSPPAPTPVPRTPAVAQTLVPAPDPGLVEQSPQGPLPVIGKNGRQPWQVYARPFDRADKRPRVAVLIGGLGLDADMTRQAIDRMPAAVTLAFDPYAKQLPTQMEGARQAGHEVLLGLPMEPTDYPRQDPGPYTLLTSIDDQQNLARLNWVLSRGTGYVGLVGLFGSRFTAVKLSLQPVLVSLKQRGLLYVDTRASEQSIGGALAKSLGLAWAVVDRAVDAEPTRASIDKALAALEDAARRDGVALGLGGLYPVTLERVGAWSTGLADRGVALAPSTAIASLQRSPSMAAQ